MTDTAVFCDVTSVTDTTAFRVRAVQAPVANATRICWMSPVDWKLYSATVVAFSAGPMGEFNILIDTPFPGIAVGHFISPQAVRQDAYFAALIAQFALMGPGEKTANLATYARAYRHPTPQSLWPSNLGPALLRAISDTGTEVLDVQYLHPLPASRVPTVPVVVTSPPNQLIPKNLAIYELTP
jgi:hypothetical protein